MSQPESSLPNPGNIQFYEDKPPFLMYFGMDSFFGGSPPLAPVFGTSLTESANKRVKCKAAPYLLISLGYLVMLGFGAFFSLVTTGIVFIDAYYGGKRAMTSEHFK